MKVATSSEQALIPEIYCPFPSQISPQYEAVKAHTQEWVQLLGLTPHKAALDYYRVADYPGLACRTYPNAGLEELFLASDWHFLIFVYDDPFDEGEFDSRQQEMLAFHKHVLAVMDTPFLTAPHGPVPTAFANLLQRASTSVSPAWLKRFARHHAEYFAAIRWQVANRERQCVPDPQAYLNNRVRAAGVLCSLDLIDIMQHREIPTEIYESQPLQAILQAGNNLVSWTNDVYSINKDVACGDVNSLVMALQQEHHCSLQEAVDRVVAMIEIETRRFQDMLWQTPGSAADIDQYVGPLWVGVMNWIRGHLDWYRGNKRYTEQATFDDVKNHLVDLLTVEQRQTHLTKHAAKGPSIMTTEQPMSATKTMTASEIECLLRAYLAGWCTPGGDPEKMITYITDDFLYEDAGANLVVHGKDAFRELVRTTLAALAFVQLPKTILVAPTLDKAAMEVTTAGTHIGEFPSMGSYPTIPVTNKPFSLTTFAFFEFRDGKISRHLEGYNQYHLFQQLGLLPEHLIAKA